jgi:Flp pilus assembly protein TadD
MLANVLSDEGRGQAADVVYAEALARSPRDWVILADWATSLALRGRERDATVLLAGARRANPLEPRLDALEETIAEGG